MNWIIAIAIAAGIIAIVAARAEKGSFVARAAQWLVGLGAALGGALWAYLTQGGG